VSAVIRLIFGHSADGVTLISRQRVEMILPAQHPASEDAVPHALVAEVRAADDRVLHRAPVRDPLEPHREVFSQEPGRSISRVPAAQPAGAFTVIVPDTPDADHLALLAAGPAHDHEGAAIAAFAAEGPREIARVSLRGPDQAGSGPR
jgi:hypothetical protein